MVHQGGTLEQLLLYSQQLNARNVMALTVQDIRPLRRCLQMFVIVNDDRSATILPAANASAVVVEIIKYNGCCIKPGEVEIYQVDINKGVLRHL